jgi:hypothetical protein
MITTPGIMRSITALGCLQLGQTNPVLGVSVIYGVLLGGQA